MPYTIGSVDPRFNLSYNELLQIAGEAEEIWEEAVGLNLFTYQDNSADAIKINLIFDERQARTLQEIASSRKLEQQWSFFQSQITNYETLVAKHNEDAAKLQEETKAYEEQVQKQKKRVAAWESGPRTSQEEYDFLIAESDRLENWRKELEMWVEKVNERKKQLDALAAQLKLIQQDLNIKTQTHNQNYTTQKFTAGEYGGYTIDIYQYYTKAHLRLTLAHEFGHALGIDHLPSPSSIMYPDTNEQNQFNPRPSQEDLAALMAICGEELSTK